MLDRIETGSALDDRQGAWLIEELEADLTDQVEDLRLTGTVPSDLGAREMVVTRAVIGWLRNGDDPGPCASRVLEIQKELRRPWQGGSDRVVEAAYAAALADLRDGHVVPSGMSPQPDLQAFVPASQLGEGIAGSRGQAVLGFGGLSSRTPHFSEAISGRRVPAKPAPAMGRNPR